MTTKKTGPARALLVELERITGSINDPQYPDIAGRKSALKYDVLPNLLKDNVNLIKQALREYCGEPESEVVTLAEEDPNQFPLL